MIAAMAWRNIWRNKKRSLITIASVFCAVLLALTMRSLQVGVFGNSVRNATSFSSGFIQVHTEGYSDHRSVNNSFADVETVLQQVDNLPHVTHVVPRLETVVISACDDKSEVALVLGVDPQREHEMNGVGGRIVEGRFLTERPDGVVMGIGLAENLGLGVGDEVVFLGQGYHGATAAGKYPVVGLLKYPVPELNHRVAMLTLPAAQQLLMADGRATSLAVMLTDDKYTERTRSRIATMLGDDFEVFTWRTTLKELAQMIQTKYASSWIIILILYMVVGFGIFGTVLMMTLERTREFGLLVAIGMKRGRLMLLSILESIFLALTGVVLGILVSVPLLSYFKANPIQLTGELAATYENFGFEPIIPVDLSLAMVLAHPTIIFIIALIAAMYPVFRLATFDPVEALRTQ